MLFWPREIEPPVFRVKVGTTMVSVSVVDAFRPPEVPLMVTKLLPGAAELLTENTTFDETDVGFGLNVAMTPAGRFDAASVTDPVKLFKDCMETYPLPVLPWPAVTLP